MITKSDWSQFIPNLVVGLLIALLLAIAGAIIAFIPNLVVGLLIALFLAIAVTVIAFIRLEKFRKWVTQAFKKLFSALKWVAKQWRFILFFGLLISLEAILLNVYADWKIVAVSLANFAIGFLGYRLLVNPPLAERTNLTASKSTFLPVALPPGIGNAYLKSHYIDPPSGDVTLGGARFLFKPDSLVFDTNEHIRYYMPRNDGGKEIELRLPEPANGVKAVHFLINSGNSKSIYANTHIGKIKLLFKDAPPIVVGLVLGQNIREWCPGNPGDWVRELSSPSVTPVWSGMSKSGTNAIIDCLKIPVYECMRNCFLEQIIFVHRSIQQPPDTMGVHFSVFAVSLEIEKRMQN